MTNQFNKNNIATPVPNQPNYPGRTLISHILFSPISTAVAFALMIFASGSVVAMTATAYPELASDNSPVAVAQAAAKTEVLGDSTTTIDTLSNVTIDDTALEAVLPSARLSAKSVSYDSTLGRWDYKISYNVSDLSGSAVLSIGDYQLQTGITASGTVETGAILKPSKTYNLYLSVDDGSGISQTIAHLAFRTSGKGRTAKGTLAPCPPMMQSGMSNDMGQNMSSSSPQSGMQGQNMSAMPAMSGSSTPSNLCITSDSGSTQCAPSMCGPIMRFNMQQGTSTEQTMPGQHFGSLSSSTPQGGMGQNGHMPPMGAMSGGSQSQPMPNSQPGQ